MITTVCRPSELGTAEISRWHELQDQSTFAATPFLAPEFAIAADRVRDDVRVAVVEEGQTTVGFLAYRRGHDGVARAVAPGLSNAQAFIRDGRYECDLASVLTAAGVIGWRYQHLTDTGSIGVAPWSTAERFVVEMGSGPEEFTAWLEHQHRARLRGWQRRARRLEGDYGPVEYRFDTADRSLVQAIIAEKRRQFAARGWRDRFSERWVMALLDELMECRSSYLSPGVSAHLLHGRLVAGQIGLTSRLVHSVWFLAYATEFGRYSPGSYLAYRAATAYGARGVQIVDFGTGENALKKQLCNARLPVASGFVGRRGPSGRFAAAAAQGVARLANSVPNLDERAHEFVQSLRRLRTSRPSHSEGTG